MQWTSIVAIYFLFFVFSAFVLLPFGALSAWPGIFATPASSCVRTPKGSSTKALKTKNRK